MPGTGRDLAQHQGQNPGLDARLLAPSLPAGMLTCLCKSVSLDTEGYVVNLKAKVSKVVFIIIY